MGANKHQSEIRDIRRRDREARQKARKNINSVLDDKRSNNGINAVLVFFHERKYIDESLPISEQLELIERDANIRIRYVELDEDWYMTTVIPMLIKTKDGRHLVIIPRVNGACVYIEKGRSHAVTKENAKQFERSALCFYKSTSGKSIGFKDFVMFIARSITNRDLITVITACVLAIAAGLLLPWVNSFIFARVIPADDRSAVVPAAALIFSAVSVAALMRLLESLIISNTIQRADIYAQSGIFSRLLSLRPDFFKKVKAGELSKMLLEFSDISKIITQKSLSAFINILLSVIYLFQIHHYAPSLTGFVIIMSVLLIVLMAAEGYSSAKWMRDYTQSLSGMSGFCQEMFSGIEHIKLNGAEARVMERWSERYADTATKEAKPALLEYLPVIYKVFTVVGTYIIFMLGHSMEPSAYIAFSISYGAYMAAFLDAGTIVETLSQFRSSYELAKPLLAEKCEDSGSAKRRIDDLRGNISISDLSFRYSEGAPYVISNLSLDIKAGESIGVIGASGSGKSTLIRLLLGFEHFSEGSLLIDGVDIRELDLRSYRKKTGVVLQNDGLLNGDIFSNITLGKPDASPEEVMLAVEKAGLGDFIEALPMGLYTPVGAENSTFSGGQLQRMIIARTLLTEPSLIIFDEATSALDGESQARIMDSIRALDGTKIIVAHRLSTIVDCDRIIVMDKGRIVQQGTYEELTKEEGIFAGLVRNSR